MSESTIHATPAEGATCASCWDDLGKETYVEYKADSAGAWLPSGFCQDCIGMLLKSQWTKYKESLSTTTCKAEQRRLLDRGPPVNLSDKNALPCPTGAHAEVYMLWYMSDGEEHSAKLEGSLEGEERERYWNEQKAFYIIDEKEDEEEGKEAKK